MDRFSILPEELLSPILDALKFEDLKQLTHVSRSFLHQCRPKLYRSVSFTVKANDQKKPRSLQLFIQLVLCLPDRGELVRDFVLIGDDGCHLRRKLDPFEPFELVLATQVLQDAKFKMRTRLISALRFGDGYSPDAGIALLLLLLPNLQTLELGVYLSPVIKIWGITPAILTPAMIRHVIHKRHLGYHWQSLEKVQYNPISRFPFEDDVPNFTDVLRMFYLPSIKSITARAVDYDRPLKCSFPVPCLPSFSTLNLQHSHIQLQTLHTLLSWLPNLRRFEYHCCLTCRKGTSYTLDCQHLRNALETRADTLEELVLTVNMYTLCPEVQFHDHIWDEPDCVILESLGDMSHFTKLKYLKAPMVFLLNLWNPPLATLSDTLPASLLDLCCTDHLCGADEFPQDYVQNMHDYVRSFLVSRAGMLRKFIVGVEVGPWLWEQDVVDSIYEACSQGEITFDIIQSAIEEFNCHSHDLS